MVRVVVVGDDVHMTGVFQGAKVDKLGGVEMLAFGELFDQLDIGLAPLFKSRPVASDQVAQGPDGAPLSPSLSWGCIICRWEVGSSYGQVCILC